MKYLKNPRIMGVWVRVAAGLLAACLVLGGCSGQEVPERRTVAFDQMQYTRPDVDNYLQQIDQAIADMAGTASAQEQIALSDGLDWISEEFSTMMMLAYVRWSQDLTDSEYQQEYEYIESEEARLQNKFNEFNQLLMDSPYRAELEEEWGADIFESIERSQRLYQPHTQSLIEQENQLTVDYHELYNSIKVNYQGQQIPVDSFVLTEEMNPQDYYLALIDYYSRLNIQLGSLYLELVQVRGDLAQQSGFADFNEMAYLRHDRDYTPQDCEQYFAQVKASIAPLYSQTVAAQAFTPLQQKESMQQIAQIIGEISPEMAECYDFLRQYQLIDFAPSSNKRVGAFTTYFYLYDTPFMFGQWGDSAQEVSTVFHEFGHAYDAYLAFASEDRTPMADSMDISEIFSQGLELLAFPYYEDLFGDEANLARISWMNDALEVLCYQTLLAEFEMRVYEAPEGWTLEGLNDLYLDLLVEYGLSSPEDRDYQIPSWMMVPHLFESPGYTISYATSLDAALQVWQCGQEEGWDEALALYERMLGDNREGGYLAMLERLELSSPFEEGRVAQLGDAISQALQQWNQAQYSGQLAA